MIIEPAAVNATQPYHLDAARPHLADAQSKRRYNTHLFQIVAPRYKEATRLLSLYRDSAWKKRLVKLLPALDKPRIIDLASGTGDIAALLLKRYSQVHILATDQSHKMLQAADSALRSNPAVTQSVQDMCAISVKDHSIDLITGSYALRNAPSLKKVLDETARVLTPEGYAAFLDFARFDNRLLWKIQYGILKFWGSLWGLVLHGNPRVYAYIAESLATYPSRTKVRKMMHASGFTVEKVNTFYFGLVELHLIRPNKAHIHE